MVFHVWFKDCCIYRPIVGGQDLQVQAERTQFPACETLRAEGHLANVPQGMKCEMEIKYLKNVF